ncbi:MAG: alpha/beta hydrolase, partial [Planctomycetota bacterium]
FNTYKDIVAAYRYLVENLNTDPNTIIVHGRSVGSGPSCFLASQKPVGGLILESAFTSVHRVAIGMSLPFDPYNNLMRIQSIDCPLLIIHGKRDSVIPFWHGQTLYEIANKPKMNYWVETAGHNDLLYRAGNYYWKTLDRFVELIQESTTERRP